MVIDKELKLPHALHLLDGTVKTIVFNTLQQGDRGGISYYKISNEKNFIPQIMDILFQLKIESVLVEGGSKLLQSFINENYWDEARIITNTEMEISTGINAPILLNQEKIATKKILTDTIDYYKHL